MNNLSFSSSQKGRKKPSNVEVGTVDPEALKTLITAFKMDYFKCLQSATELHNYYSKKEIYDALVLIECCEKCLDNI